MVQIQLCGRAYPLCLTVAALDEVFAKCGGLEKISNFIRGVSAPSADVSDPDTSAAPEFSLAAAAKNTAWLLHVLVREGENNRLLSARLRGEEAARIPVPSPEDLSSLLTITEVLTMRNAIMDAVAESLHREIEAENPKNVKDAEQK